MLWYYESYTKTCLQLISLYVCSLVFCARSTGVAPINSQLLYQKQEQRILLLEGRDWLELLGNLDDYLSIGGSRHF